MDFAAIRRSAPILEAARRLGIEVTRNRARCFHPERHKNNDRTPSLSFNPAKNNFCCWVCPEVRGSVLDLVMQVRGIDVKAAANWLFQEGLTHLQPPPVPPSSAPRLRSGTEGGGRGWSERGGHGRSALNAQSAPATDDLSLRKPVFAFLLDCCEGLTREALAYLKSRRIFRKTADRMRLSSIRNYEEVSGRLEDRFGLDLLRRTGLFNSKGHFRFYRHNLLIPYFVNREPVWFQARTIDPAASPKELNLPCAIPAPYNIDGVRNAPLVYLCEGAIDTLTLIEQGFPAAGIPGARNFKPEWVDFFAGKKIFSAFDADPAGRMGNERMAALFGARKIPFSVLPIPEGRDINDLFTGKA